MNIQKNKKSWVEQLECIMEQLRSEHGCPWDKAQNHESLKQYCLEEAYEVLEAIDSKNDQWLKDELGDLLLQVIFHAQLAKERGAFDFESIAQTISEKMIRRHPHVFSTQLGIQTPEDVERQWESIKQTETQTTTRVKKSLDVCRTLPALSKAQKVSKKAAKFGFDWKELKQVYAKVEEELLELQQSQTQQEKQEEFGDMLFAMCSLARHEGLDAESCLNNAVEKFKKRFYQVETIYCEKNQALQDVAFDDLHKTWQKVK